MRPGDVLILVRQRGPLFEAIIRALKNAGIRGRGRRPADADRAYRGDGSDGARRRAAAAGRRSGARDACSRARCSVSTTSSCSRSPGTRPAARCARRLRAKARDDPQFADAAARARPSAPARRGARRRSPSMRGCSGRTAGGASSLRGSAARRTTRSTNFSISRSTTSSARRHRCRASSRGCAPPIPRSSATWRSRRDEVRVMTVHGAKGLEAPIVILADTTTPPAGPRATAAAAAAAPAPRRARPTGCLGAARKDEDVGADARGARRARAEARERISPAALRGDDAGRRPPDRLRRRGRAASRPPAAGTIWCMTDWRRSRRRGAGRRRRRQGLALSQGACRDEPRPPNRSAATRRAARRCRTGCIGDAPRRTAARRDRCPRPRPR